VSRGAKILLVDDDPAVLRGVGGLLRDEGFRIAQATSAQEAYAAVHAPRDPPAMMLLDVRMPGETGLQLLARLPHPLPLPVVVLSGEASIADTVQALKLGATDFVEKPPSPERLLTAIRNALALSALEEERQRLVEALARPGSLVGESQAMDGLRRLIARLGPSPSVVLVTGETGTGKERVARSLHESSARKGRFVAVNCAAIPAQLLESELFGYERGAFSGAVSRRIGRIEQAQGGTLLLDEIGDMPLELQSKLLRVLEQKEIERLGGTGPVPIDVRVVAATHQDLAKRVVSGGFREDLFYRLNVVPIEIPPLRARPDDIVPLARAFASELAGPHVVVTVTPGADAGLRSYPWPGNVRELRNFVERMTLLRPAEQEGEGLLIDEGAVGLLRPRSINVPSRAGEAWTGGGPPGLGERSYRELVEEFERALVQAALSQSGANIAAAARILRMDRGNLYRRMQALGIGLSEPPPDSGEG
jgi:DNA-binding NtrC family response regulator